MPSKLFSKPALSWETATFAGLLCFWAALTFSTALIEISFFATLACWVLNKWQFRIGFSKIPKTILIPLVLYLACVTLSLFFSEYPASSVRGLLKVFKQAAIFYIVYDTFSSSEKLGKFERFFILVAFIICLDGFSQYSFGRDFLRWKMPEDSGAGMRLSASFGTYGKFASFLIAVIPAVIAIGVYFRNHLKAWHWWYLSLLSFAGSAVLLFLTRSRGAMAAFAIGSVLILVLRRKWLVLGAFALFAGGLFLIVPRNMVIHLDSELKEQSLVERFYLWDRAVHVIKAKPFTGTGINTYTRSHAKYDETNSWRVKNYYAHNGFLQLAAEIGIPGLIAFLWFLASYFMYSMKWLSVPQEMVRWGLLTGLLNFLVLSCVDTVLHNPQPVLMFWFLLGLQLAYLNRLKSVAKNG
jgi:putative inorganic carbon (hco3(-)) transporter